MKSLAWTVALFALVGCANPRTRIIESEWASMTQSKVPQAKDVVSTGPVKGDFCFSSFGSGHVGLMDEAIKKAQNTYAVDYIKNATFTMESRKSCVYVEGEGYKTKR
jgi:hypothetical protein